MALRLILDFLKNPLFLAAAASWAAAQVCKLILQLILRGDKSRLLSGGGMPSSHTATMMGLVIETALIYGTAGFEFPMVFFFMIMVVFDALNVRYVTGEQDKVLNHMVQDKVKEAEQTDKTKDPEGYERMQYYRSVPRLKEVLGHTLPEVLVGAVIGIAVAVIIYNVYPM